MGEWECMECGYIAPGQKRPDHCPECDAPTEAFEYFEYEEDNFEDFDDLVATGMTVSVLPRRFA